MRPKLWVGVNLARLWAARAERDKAFELLEPIFNRFSEGFQTRDLVAAANLLQRLQSHAGNRQRQRQ
jgi:predicted ATPase